jgi:hypothetical protein
MNNNKLDDFAVMILTHGRPDKVRTFQTLHNCGYTGRIVIVIDNTDKKQKEYKDNFGDMVYVFDKKAIAKTFDQGDNFEDMRAIIYARNASFEIAKELGIKYFIQLDDDYVSFNYRFNNKLDYEYSQMKNLDSVFSALLEFYKSTNISSIAIAQGGDFMGGAESSLADKVKLKRKCMNSFICSTERPFKFVGRINEDVNTYTRLASTGLLLFTTNQVSLQQLQTQSNSGGMTELYLDSGTYVKSFYSVMYMPSAVRVKMLNSTNARLHHSVSWINTVPMILSEDYKKKPQ